MNDPGLVGPSTADYWTKVEAWPRHVNLESLSATLEDKYSLFVPHLPFLVNLTGTMVKEHVDRMRVTTWGPDSWSVQEAKQLPPAAWEALLNLVNNKTYNWKKAGFLVLAKRTPVPKDSASNPGPGDIRPIDVHSVILCAIAGTLCSYLREWLRTMLHDSQCAASGGVILASARIALSVQAARLRAYSVISISLDFSKMFNMMSARAAGLIAKWGGLAEENIRLLVEPIEAAQHVWRLAYNCVSPLTVSQRGLPQGLPSSVTLAELMICVLIRRLHTCVQCSTTSYMDDIHVETQQEHQMRSCIQIILEYVRDLGLQISLLKTVTWGSSEKVVARLAKEFGFSHVKTFEALGAFW